MQIEFFGVLGCFAAFLPLERVGAGRPTSVGGPSGRSAARGPATSRRCARCAGDVSVALLGDWSHRLRPVAGDTSSLDDWTMLPLPCAPGTVGRRSAARAHRTTPSTQRTGRSGDRRGRITGDRSTGRVARSRSSSPSWRRSPDAAGDDPSSPVPSVPATTPATSPPASTDPATTRSRHDGGRHRHGPPSSAARTGHVRRARRAGRRRRWRRQPRPTSPSGRPRCRRAGDRRRHAQGWPTTPTGSWSSTPERTRPDHHPRRRPAHDRRRRRGTRWSSPGWSSTAPTT